MKKNNEEVTISMDGSPKKSMSDSSISMNKPLRKKKIAFTGKSIPRKKVFENKTNNRYLKIQGNSKKVGLSLPIPDSPDSFSADGLLEEIGAEEKLEQAREEVEKAKEETEKLKKTDVDIVESKTQIINQKEVSSIPLSDDKNIKLELPVEKKLKRCPVCNGKLKKSWVKKTDNIYVQKIKCKGKGHLFWKQKCEFEKELVMQI